MDKEELKARLYDHEDGWVERKTKNIKDEEILEALVGFANSVPPKEKGLLFIGVSDDGKPLGVDNPDKLQKKINRLSDWCYPGVEYQCQVITEDDFPIVAVIIEASDNRPHFAGPAYIRVGSQFRKASERKFNELIDRRIDIVNWILAERDADREVYIEDKRYSGAPRNLCKVKECNSQYAVFQVLPASDDLRSTPVSKISMSRNQGLAMFTIYP
jgi:hypothetical protein